MNKSEAIKKSFYYSMRIYESSDDFEPCTMLSEVTALYVSALREIAADTADELDALEILQFAQKLEEVAA